MITVMTATTAITTSCNLLDREGNEGIVGAREDSTPRTSLRHAMAIHSPCQRLPSRKVHKCESEDGNREQGNPNVENPPEPPLSPCLSQTDHSWNHILCTAKAPKVLRCFVNLHVSGIPPAAVRADDFNVFTRCHGNHRPRLRLEQKHRCGKQPSLESRPTRLG
jgi:hypothetical protein